MGTGLAGFTVQSAPPDTDGDIGPNHYVQIVNSGVTIFSRAGAKLLGPMNTNTFWNGFTGACATTNDGDGVVRYDRIADRWVIAQFSVNGGNGPFFQCVAVSTTPDPTGTLQPLPVQLRTTLQRLSQDGPVAGRVLLRRSTCSRTTRSPAPRSAPSIARRC